jgi:hypothetical protein
MTQIEGTLPISKVSPKHSPEERNICKQLGKMRRYLAVSTDANFSSSCENRIIVYEGQLAKAEARARFIMCCSLCNETNSYGIGFHKTKLPPL